MQQGPIFIGGLDRTGKTLMRLALSLHPNIIITKRTDLWVKFYNRFGDLSQEQNFENCLAAIMTSKHIRALKPDLSRLRFDFHNSQPTYARLFALFHEQLAQSENKPRWGDQSELIERYADAILEAYPNAKMIHMIRDPRDRYSASKQKWTAGRGKVGAATARWIYSTRLAQRNSAKYPDRYKVVRYEELVSDPEKTLEAVCSFLNEEYDPSMLLIGHIRGIQEEIVLPDYLQENHFLKTFMGEYKFNLSKYEIEFIQSISPAMLQAYDYAPAPIQFSKGERASYWGKHLPRNLGAMIYWLSIQSKKRPGMPALPKKRDQSKPNRLQTHQNEKLGEVKYE